MAHPLHTSINLIVHTRSKSLQSIYSQSLFSGFSTLSNIVSHISGQLISPLMDLLNSQLQVHCTDKMFIHQPLQFLFVQNFHIKFISYRNLITTEILKYIPSSQFTITFSFLFCQH